jgi:hypothetical protein
MTVKIEIDVRSAAAVRQVLFEAQRDYTYDSTCVPKRVVDIREVIGSLDTQIEEVLKEEANDET